MAQKIEAPIYHVLCDENCQRFYKGADEWTENRDRAKVFVSLGDLMAECERSGIKRCKVVEIFPRTGMSFSLHLNATRAEHLNRTHWTP